MTAAGSLAVFVNGAVDVTPVPGHLHVGLVDKPPAAYRVPTWPSSFDQQRREALDPAVDRDVIHLDAALEEEFLDVPEGKAVAEVPTNSEHDDLGRESVAGERRPIHR